MLVKYSCGCIGFLPSTASGESLLIDNCDRDQGDMGEYSLFFRHMEAKTCTPLTEEEEKKYFQELSHLIHLGYRMKDLAYTVSSIIKK